MGIQLTWQDLLIEDIPGELAERCLREWDFLLSGRFAVIGMSRFGDWYLRRMDGTTDELSAIDGTLATIAGTPEEFSDLMNLPQWQEEHLLSWLVARLYEKGMIAGPNQCYGFAPHPSLTGKIDPDRAMILLMPVWQTICAQTFATAKR